MFSTSPEKIRDPEIFSTLLSTGNGTAFHNLHLYMCMYIKTFIINKSCNFSGYQIFLNPEIFKIY